MSLVSRAYFKMLPIPKSRTLMQWWESDLKDLRHESTGPPIQSTGPPKRMQGWESVCLGGFRNLTEKAID